MFSSRARRDNGPGSHLDCRPTVIAGEGARKPLHRSSSVLDTRKYHATSCSLTSWPTRRRRLPHNRTHNTYPASRTALSSTNPRDWSSSQPSLEPVSPEATAPRCIPNNHRRAISRRSGASGGAGDEVSPSHAWRIGSKSFKHLEPRRRQLLSVSIELGSKRGPSVPPSLPTVTLWSMPASQAIAPTHECSRAAFALSASRPSRHAAAFLHPPRIAHPPRLTPPRPMPHRPQATTP